MRKVITTLICCFVLLLNTIPIQAKEKIKVAFPIQPGLTELTQDWGNLQDIRMII